MKVGIFGLPNSGKSSFRRWLVAKLREAGYKAEHWDADRFKKNRCPEDADMKEPPLVFDEEIVWLIEDVRGTLEYGFTVTGEAKGAWRPLDYYDVVFYLQPLWPTYAFFWMSRALQWRKAGMGNWSRETGWENMPDEAAIEKKVWHFFSNYEKWLEEDERTLKNGIPMLPVMVIPCWNGNAIEWNWGFNALKEIFSAAISDE